jgi:hypothetical protein
MGRTWNLSAVLGLAAALVAAGGDVASSETPELRGAQQTQADREPPDWFVTEVRRMVNDGDAWITDNAPFMSDDEPWAEYGMVWQRAQDGNGATGRLFGLVDGEERATFWEMRLSWDEERQEARIWQRSGDSTVGEGTMKATGHGIETEAIQTFTAPDGTTSEVRHLSTTTEDTHVTRSFDRVADAWQPRREYVWKKRPR